MIFYHINAREPHENIPLQNTDTTHLGHTKYWVSEQVNMGVANISSGKFK